MGYILVGTIIGGIIWGIVVNKVIENKGYEENWFWWGFFFGIFALIIALTKQSVNTTKVVIESSAPVKENMELLTSDILNKQVNISSPVHISSWEIKKDAERLVLFVDFINVSQKAISAVMFSATGFNSFGDRVQINGANLFDVIGQDLSIKPNEYGKVYTTLQDAAIRKVEIKVKKICFADGTIVDDIQDEWINTNQFELSSIHIDCAKRENIQSKYYSIIKEHYWQCVCGFVNTQNTCAVCGMQKDNTLKFTQENFDNTYSEYLKQIELKNLNEEKRRLEKERKQEEEKIKREKKKQKYIKYIFAFGCVAVVFMTVTVVFNKIIIPHHKYNSAITCFRESRYDEAVALLKSIGKYKDSKDILLECEYQKGKQLMNEGKYDKSREIFLDLKGYKDCEELEKTCYNNLGAIVPELENLNVGGEIIFGSYEQNNDVNTREPIVWRVLNAEDGKHLLVSKYILDLRQYHSHYETVTWEKTDLRKWLNSQFLDTAFNEEQKRIIEEIDLTNPDGENTLDKVFLLSTYQAKEYFSHDNEEILAEPTPYVISLIEEFGTTRLGSNGCYGWWLRSDSDELTINHISYADQVMDIKYRGSYIARDGAGIEIYKGVRPAIWIDGETLE